MSKAIVKIQRDPFKDIPYFSEADTVVMSTSNNGTDIYVPVRKGLSESDILRKKQELRLWLKNQKVKVSLPDGVA